MLADINTMTVEELVGRQQVAEDADAEDQEVASAGDAGKLYLTEEQWEARRRRRVGEERARHGNRKKGDGRGGGHGEDDDDTSTCSGSSRRSERRNRGRCFNCNERGHITKFCPQACGKAMMADAGEEPTLL